MAILPTAIQNKIQQDSVENLNERFYAVEYGDGYSQRASIGVNAKFKTWNIRAYPLTESERTLFKTFWNNHGFVTSWDWIPPGESVTSKWIFISPPAITNIAKVYDLTFEIKQVFEE